MASNFGPDKPRLSAVKSSAAGSFGDPPPSLAVETPQPEPTPKPQQLSAEEIAQVAAAPPRPKRVIVDETVEKAVTVRHSTVIFRPGQVIIDPFLLQIANENGVHLIEK